MKLLLTNRADISPAAAEEEFFENPFMASFARFSFVSVRQSVILIISFRSVRCYKGKLACSSPLYSLF